MKKRFQSMIGLLMATTVLAGCDGNPKSGRGLILPEGNAVAGEAAFLRLHCNDCHRVAGREDLPTGEKPLMSVTLGGKRTRVTTYGELVTSIINPSHKISRRYSREPYARDGVSEMRNYNELMTVAQLTDLVTFLQQYYELQPYSGPSYTSYYPGESGKAAD